MSTVTITDEPKSLGEALPREMARIRDEVMPAYRAIGPSGAFAIGMMRNLLDVAAKAMVEGDTVAMLHAYQALRGFNT